MRRIRSRAAVLAGATVLTVTMTMSGSSPAAATTAHWRRCSGTISVTKTSVGRMTAHLITVDGPIGCSGAKRTIHALFGKELEPNGRCAEAVNKPSAKGCRVGSFTCHGSASLRNAVGCVADKKRIAFREREIPLG